VETPGNDISIVNNPVSIEVTPGEIINNTIASQSVSVGIQQTTVSLTISGARGEKGDTGATGADGAPGDSYQEAFETVSKNLKSYPGTFAYGSGDLQTITYDLGGALSIIKTIGRTGLQITSITLSGDTPNGIALTKTLSYSGEQLTGVSYA